MARVVVERSFESPIDFDEIQALEKAVTWCMKTHRVRYLRTYFSADRRHMVCVYEAPDADAVRHTQREGGIPFDRIWTGSPIELPGPEAVGAETVVVQRAWDPPMTIDDIANAAAKAADCNRRHRIQYDNGFLADAGDVQICVFKAPDAEAVRAANRENGVPFERAWKAEVIEPPAS